MKNHQKQVHIARIDPVCFNIVVQGVGFEPTNAFAIGS